MLYYYKVKKRHRYKELFTITIASLAVWAYLYFPGSLANVVPELDMPSRLLLPSSGLSNKKPVETKQVDLEDAAAPMSLAEARKSKLELEREGKKKEAAEIQYCFDLLNKLKSGNDDTAKTREKIIQQDIDKTVSYFRSGNTTSEKLQILRDYNGGNLAYVYYPHYGVHFNPVTTANVGIEYYAKGNHTKAIRIADELLAHSIRKEYAGVGPYLIWENYFDLEFGAQKFPAPWNSGMAQGLVLDLVGKSYEITKDKKYLRAGELILNSFRVPWDKGGVTDYDEHGNWYLEVAATNKLRILNGFLFTLDGIHDYHERTGNTKALKLFDVGVREAKEHLDEYDLGYWSNYSLVQGNKASFEYHKVHVALLYRLFHVTHEPTFKNYADKFNDYLKYSFIDIPKEHRSFTKINALAKADVIEHGSGWFGPHNSISKADFAVWLCRLKGWAPNVVFQGHYRDIGRDRPYWGYLEALKDKGVNLAGQDGRFWPEDELTRAKAAEILCAAYDTSKNSPPLMKDVTDTTEYNRAVELAVSNNLMQMYEKNYFRPDLKMTREQAANILYELLGR